MEHNDYGDSDCIEVGGSMITVCHDDYYLKLKPISSITDEDLVTLYHLHSLSIGYDYTMDFQPPLVMAYHWKNNDKKWLANIFDFRITSDFLRSNGYALPWCWYTVDELVKVGWIKLKI